MRVEYILFAGFLILIRCHFIRGLEELLCKESTNNLGIDCGPDAIIYVISATIASVGDDYECTTSDLQPKINELSPHCKKEYVLCFEKCHGERKCELSANLAVISLRSCQHKEETDVVFFQYSCFELDRLHMAMLPLAGAKTGTTLNLFSPYFPSSMPSTRYTFSCYITPIENTYGNGIDIIVHIMVAKVAQSNYCQEQFYYNSDSHGAVNIYCSSPSSAVNIYKRDHRITINRQLKITYQKNVLLEGGKFWLEIEGFQANSQNIDLRVTCTNQGDIPIMTTLPVTLPVKLPVTLPVTTVTAIQVTDGISKSSTIMSALTDALIIQHNESLPDDNDGTLGVVNHKNTDEHKRSEPEKSGNKATTLFGVIGGLACLIIIVAIIAVILIYKLRKLKQNNADTNGISLSNGALKFLTTKSKNNSSSNRGICITNAKIENVIILTENENHVRLPDDPKLVQNENNKYDILLKTDDTSTIYTDGSKTEVPSEARIEQSEDTIEPMNLNDRDSYDSIDSIDDTGSTKQDKLTNINNQDNNRSSESLEAIDKTNPSADTDGTAMYDKDNYLCDSLSEISCSPSISNETNEKGNSWETTSKNQNDYENVTTDKMVISKENPDITSTSPEALQNRIAHEKSKDDNVDEHHYDTSDNLYENVNNGPNRDKENSRLSIILPENLADAPYSRQSIV